MTTMSSKKLYFFFILILVPLFINLDISQGLRFDISVFNRIELNRPPSLPLSSFVVLFLFFFNIRILLKKFFILFFLVTLIISFLTVISGNTRIIIVFIQMNLFLICFYIFKDIFKDYNKYVLLDLYFKSISLIILIKFCFDFFLFQEPNTMFFLDKSLVIYNYYDYFPFIYFMGGILSLRNIWYKKNFLISLIIFTISLISLIHTHSRVFTYSFYIVPFLILFYQIIKLNKSAITILYLLIVILLTFIFAYNPTLSTEASMISRFSMWKSYFNSFTVTHLLFPFFNDYRNHISHGSLHNELLEIFSYFGFFSLLFLFQIYKIFSQPSINGYSIVVKLILFVIIFGMLIQSNMLNPYLSVQLTLFLSLTSSNNNKVSLKV